MIAAIGIAVFGLLLVVLAVLLRKKLGTSWTISLIAAGLLALLLGGFFTVQQWNEIQRRRESVYLGLRYLERYEEESCAYYLKQAGQEDSFPLSAGRGLLERLRENELSARLNLTMAQSAAKSKDEQQLLEALWELEVQDPEKLGAAVNRLIAMLNLSGRRSSRLDAFLQVEAGYGGDTLAEEEIDQDTVDRLQISALLRNGAYEQAVSTAVRLTDRSPNEANRLLLAETVAESAYNSVPLSGTAFVEQTEREAGLPQTEPPQEDLSVQKEREKLDRRREELEGELAELELLGAGDQKENDQRRLELTEEIQALRSRSDKLYVYRAFNAIAGLRSTKADLVRARLYFALQDYDQAMETLQDTADSFRVTLSPDRELANSLRTVADAWEGDKTFRESQEFQDMLVYLLSEPFPDLMYVSQTGLTRDFAQQIISDLKVYGKSLFVSQLDTQDFPQIHVTLSGREELLRQIIEGEGIQCHDTRETVEYTASIEEAAMSDVCVVVDRSGSMGGSPMENLKLALEDFIRNMTAETTVSLVAFEDSAEILTELTQDQATLLAQVGGLAGGGGTNITAGIQAGIESLANAPGGRVMLLMTDGQSNVDFTVVEEAAAAGITIHTIGFGSVNDALLQEIAERTGGQYVRAESSAELSSVYASLQQIIGHVITLDYTAPAPEEEQRYFFIRVGEYSVRVDYSLAREGLPESMLYSCWPTAVSTEELARRQEQNQNISLRLQGEQLSQVDSVSVGGQTAQIEDQREEQLSVTVSPRLQPGWQTVTLRLRDGTEASFDKLFFVGETISVPSLRLGSLTIQRSQGVLPGDGTLALMDSGIRLRENLSQEISSLSMYVRGTLVFSVTPEQEEQIRNANYSDEISLGEQGSITGWGIAGLDSGDAAYVSGAPEVAAKGSLEFDCQSTQSKLIQNGEGGN